MLRAFFQHLKKELVLDPGPFYSYFYKNSEDIRVIAVNPERLKYLIYNNDFHDSLSSSLRVWKDMFVFGCTTALRFSDLMRVRCCDFENTDGGMYLVITSKKTQTFSRVWLPDYACEIVQRYSGFSDLLFPGISKVNFNKAVKRIALAAGWVEEMPKTRNRRGEAVPLYSDTRKKLQYRFCDLVSSHTMRRTAITTMLRMGMNEINVRIISGHNANSASFYRYVQYSESFMNEEMSKVFEKLKETK